MINKKTLGMDLIAGIIISFLLLSLVFLAVDSKNECRSSETELRTD